jgi:hypothetical protein
MAQDFRLDFTTQIIVATSAVDTSITVPVPTAGNFPTTNFGSWWLMGVSGQPIYLNQGSSPATSANISMPVGVWPRPYWIPGGTVYHAITAGGSGQLWLVRAYLTMV